MRKHLYTIISIVGLSLILTGCQKSNDATNTSSLARVQKYTKIIQLDPQNARAYIELARTYNEIGEKETQKEAKNLAEKALSLPLTDIEKSDALLEKAAASSGKNNILPDIRQAISLNPNNKARAYQITGAWFWRKNQSKQALESLDVALSIDPQNGEAYYWRGRAYHSLKNYQKALEDYDKALQYTQSEDLKAWVYSMRCTILSVNMKQWNQSIEEECTKGQEMLLKQADQYESLLKSLSN